LKIRDLVSVVPQPAVIRLDHLNEAQSEWITERYFITGELERHIEALKHLLARDSGSGIFVIGHYGSGKSHFLAYTTQQITTGSFAARPKVFPISLLNYPASETLESIITKSLLLADSGPDRRAAWEKAHTNYPDGLFVVIDELSEFLRSKPTRQAFNEDLRFLQFLGEWGQNHLLWVMAALQEQIEHAGDIEYDLYRKIKDRYPVRFLLTPAHVKDLIARKVLEKKPAYRETVEALAKDLKVAFSNTAINFHDFCELYPIHPVTMELLEEVRDRFSQARGFIDFVLTQLLGNPARGILPFLEEPWGRLLGPDRIVDHFADLFEVQPEFLPIAQKLFPYFRKRIPDLFENKAQQELAWRLLKLLVLVHLSPVRKRLDAQEAVQWLLVKVSTLQPEKNLDMVQRVLDTLTREGAYLKKDASHYRLDLEDDSQQILEQLLAKAVAELQGRGDALFESLIPCLDREEFNPFVLPRDRWQSRKVLWHFHEREIQVWLGGGVIEGPKGLGLQIGLPWGPPPESLNGYRVAPKPIDLTQEILELAALLQLKSRPLPPKILERIGERIASRRVWFCRLVQAAYLEASLVLPLGQVVASPLGRQPRPLQAWLNGLGEWMLRQTYPMFERFAPAHGPLPREAYRQFMQFASEGDWAGGQAPEFVQLIQEAYLVPMGLLQRRGSEYVAYRRPDQHELVRLLAPLLDHHPSPKQVYEHLAAPVYGLVPDQVHLLLLTLLLQGDIDLLKGNRSYRDHYETLISPLQYDAVVPGHGLNAMQLRELQLLCDGFDIKSPKQWSVSAQKRAISQLKGIGSNHREVLGGFLLKLKELGQAESLAEQVEKCLDQWRALEKGEHELQGFQQFLFEAGSASRFAAQARELAALPGRFESLLREVQRYRHLFGFPCLAQCSNKELADGVARLGQPPSLAESEGLENWLALAQRLYADYQQWYRTEHDRWWQLLASHAIWSYQWPAIAASKHLSLDSLSREIAELQTRARSEKCQGLVNLDFQPLCRCGFDGTLSPIAKTLGQFDKVRDRLAAELRQFFQQEKVKAKVREWVDQKLESNPGTLSYLAGKAELPHIENLAVFDQHLSGLELAQTVDTGALFELLSSRTWERQQLVRELDRFLERFGSRVSIARPTEPVRQNLVVWCLEQSLRHAVPLPAGFTLEESKWMAFQIQPSWIGEGALGKLEQLGLSEPAVDRIVEFLLDGKINTPKAPPCSGLAAAALQILRPGVPASVFELAQEAREAYQQHPRFMRLRPGPWLSRLEELAHTPLQDTLPPLTDVLRECCDWQWVVVDALGLLLQPALAPVLEDLFAHWQMQPISYGLASPQTRTEAFYEDLLGAGFQRPFFKIDALDELIHSGDANFANLEKRARAELEIHARRLAGQLDPQRPLLIFADHGFRLASDGRSFAHGGPSILERVVPVFRMKPR
jgi:hypothetical protein